MGLSEEGIIEVAGLSSQWVRLASGAKAHFVTSGETGPAVVLLHGGLPGSSGTAGWRFMAPFLGANGFRVYCPDVPGFGLADNRQEHWPMGVHSHVDFLQEFVTALGIDCFHLAGNSMGATNTINYVIAHPERILSFILIATDVGDIVPPGRRPPAKVELEAYDGTREGMRKMMSAIIYRDEAISDDLVEMRWLSADRQKEARAQWWPSMLQFRGDVPWQDENLAARLSTRGRIDRLNFPALYLYGRQDILTPVEWGYEQEDVLPNIQFFYPDECGHQGQTDRPDLFNQVFLEFFSTGKVTRSTADLAGVSSRRPEIADLVEKS